jgi:hypothetical protein
MSWKGVSQITEVELPMLVIASLGYLYITFIFTGSITTAYGAERNLVPSRETPFSFYELSANSESLNSANKSVETAD